jgi:hypothetical protein
MAVKCKVKMGDRVAPVEGSVQTSGVGGGTGQCPQCLTPGVQLSIVGGYVRAHVVSSVETAENNPQPATVVEAFAHYGKGLTEPQTAVTDAGVCVGDPRAAEKRRVIVLETAAGTGTVKVPRRVKSGGVTKKGAPRMTTKMVAVAATEEHVREALAYWQNKRVKVGKDGRAVSESARQTRDAMIAEMFARLDALYEAPSLSAREQDAAQGHRGPTLVQGRDTTPRLRDPELPWTEPTDLRRDGRVRLATTNEQPRGRERPDRKIITVPEPAPVPEPVPVLSASQKRRARRNRCRTAYAVQQTASA